MAGMLINGNTTTSYAANFKMGALSEDINEINEHRESALPDSSKSRAISYPSSVDLSQSKYFPAIMSQGGLGSCVAFATTYYQFTYEANRLNNIDSSNSVNCYSPSWTYNYVNGGVDGGARVGDAYKILKERGSLKLSDFPYTSDYRLWSNNTQAMINALKTRVSEYYALELDTANNPIKNNSSSSLYKIKGKLNEGKCLIIACQTNGEMSNMSIGTAQNGEKIIYRCTNENSGHAMTIVGYNDRIAIDVNKDGKIEAAEMGAFKVANSWGTDWYKGNKGYIWVLYDALNNTSQISGSWENNLSGSRRAVFARNDDESKSNNILYYIDVTNKNVDVVSKIEFTADYKRNFYPVIGKVKQGYSYMDKNIFTTSESNIKGTGTNDIIVLDNSEFNYDEEEVLGNNEWTLSIKKDQMMV